MLSKQIQRGIDYLCFRRASSTRLDAMALVHKVSPLESGTYYSSALTGGPAEVAKRYGAEMMAEIEWTAWNDEVALSGNG